MGWASGSDLFIKIIKATRASVDDWETRFTLYKDFIDAFSESDWDTQDEALEYDDAYDEAYKIRFIWGD